ncbi:TPA: hypothetical protein L4687_005213 [Pseudomonas aeruginosa]|nr:hypothetical protein [Pseudomonas aeruginosa]
MDKHTKQAPRNGNGANSPTEHQSGQPPASPSKAERYSERKPSEQKPESDAKATRDPVKNGQQPQAARGDDDLMSQEAGHQGPSSQQK